MSTKEKLAAFKFARDVVEEQRNTDDAKIDIGSISLACVHCDHIYYFLNSDTVEQWHSDDRDEVVR